MAYNSLMNKEKAKPGDDAPRQIAVNRRARHDYFIEEHYEAGLVLQGWEVKSLREGRAQVADAYVKVLGEEAFLIGAHFLPASGISTHVQPDPTRSRKLLLHADQLRPGSRRLGHRGPHRRFLPAIRDPAGVAGRELPGGRAKEGRRATHRLTARQTRA